MTTRRRVRKRTRKSDEPRKVMSVSAKRKLEQLQRTIPGCSGPLEVDSGTLFKGIADYISFLELKASLLRAAISSFPDVSKRHQLH
ncbi:hypothetical protein SAY87_018134 [Trapa incisa]|uniref:BHLH domain-containing protein n=1 Tax=Trapa incisa TaxID=236973 RepID=A0AAN7QTI4_9MYRT|nr:hypothetical protein SAY87_018134 [Trapa incisa]